MMTENCQQIKDELVEVDFARVFQEAVLSSRVLKFVEASLKNKILNSDKDQLLVVKSTINSPKEICAVDFYDKEFLINSLKDE
jgi:hypothetical protein